ncbi:DUF4011 domain-containing protein [Gammaproteobacteria bacterium]|nr:DUF4011 domain-containing protein [Gammaproteobacteria bacterium]
MEFLAEQVAKLRKKLLDTSRRSNLIKFNHSPRSTTHIRIVDEIPENLWEKLESGSTLTFKALPELHEEPPDEKTDDFQQALAESKSNNSDYTEKLENLEADEELDESEKELRAVQFERELRDSIRATFGLPELQTEITPDLASHARLHKYNPNYNLTLESSSALHIDNEIQTLLLPQNLERRLQNIRSQYDSKLRDTGINTLNLGLFFLDWYSEKDRNTRLSPIFLAPVEIKRTKTQQGFKYPIKAESASIFFNETLVAALLTEGVELPRPEQNENESIQLNEFINRLQDFIDDNPKFKRWKIRNFATFGFFNFSNIGIYQDLDPALWNQEDFLQHPLLSDVLGARSVDVFPDNSDIELDKLILNGEAPPLILDADSSQHTAITAGYSSTSVVIQGPPGTGKSQTIANLIGALVSQGKKVLFLAEKQPALDVVSNRLKSLGLESLLLEPSDKLSKENFYKALDDRLEFSHDGDSSAYNKKRSEIIENMTRSRQYGEYLQRDSGFLDSSMFELIWKYIHLEKETAYLKFDPIFTIEKSKYSEEDQKKSAELLELHYEFVANKPPVNENLKKFTKLSPNKLAIESFSNSLRQCKSTLEEIIRYNEEFSNLSGKAVAQNLIKNIVHQAKSIDLLNITLDVEQLTTETERLAQDIKTIDDYSSSRDFLLENFEKPTISSIESLYDLANKNQWAEISSDFLSAELIESQQNTDSLTNLFQKFLSICPEIEENFLALCKELLANQSDQKNILTALSLNIDLTTQNSIEQLTKIRSGLDSIFTLQANIGSKIPVSKIAREVRIADLEKAVYAMKNANFFSFLNRDYRAQKIFLNSFGLDPNSSYDLLHTLPKLISIKKELQTLRTFNPILSQTVTEVDLEAGVANAHHLLNISQTAAVRTAIQSISSLIGKPLTSQIYEALSETSASINIDTKNILISCNDFNELLEKNEQLITDVKETRTVINTLGLREESTVKISIEHKEKYLHTYARFETSSQKLKTCYDIDVITDELLEGEKNKAQSKLESLQEQQMALIKFSETMGGNYNYCPEKITSIISFDLAVFSKTQIQAKHSLLRITEIFGFVFKHEDTQEYLETKTIKEITSQFTKILDLSKNNLFNQISRLAIEKEIDAHYLSNFFKKLIDGKVERKADAENLLNLGICKFILLRQNNMQGHQDFIDFNGGLLEQLKMNFKGLDESLQKLEQDRILSVLSKVIIPSGINYGRKSEWSGKSLLQHQISLKRRIGLRALINRAFDALQSLNPVWFMQPQNVSKYLPKRINLFDTVIIDEASQMLPQNALGSILRGQQLIIVGDSQQMPPSNFFQSGYEDEDDEDAPLEESILQLCETRLPRNIMLQWHYRSKHPDLIRFSNEKFYDGNLRIFPSPLTSNENVGIENIKVEGVFKGQINIIEAQRVILEAKKCMARFPDSSLGIVAINVKQRDYIEAELNRLADTDTIIQEYHERWTEDVLNFPFIKNLERVQGDERDIIIISTVYGPDEHGNVYQRFGPINSDQGYRRLNVLYTRARQKIIHITSLNASDIRPSERPSRGVITFRDYLEYAATGRVDGGQVTGNDTDSDFELAVCRALEQKGFVVTPQVGVKGFFIDIGVTHRSSPHGFIAGIECDGATYHSSPSARDRDKIRQDVLESLGWRIYRIWSTDWFNNHQKETEKLVEYLNKIISAESPDQSDAEIRGAISKSNAVNIDHFSGNSEDHATEAEVEYEEMLRGRGAVTETEIGDRTFRYFAVSPTYFEYWVEEKMVGSIEKIFIERTDSHGGYGDALKNVSKPVFIATMETSKEEKEFESLSQALLWIDRLSSFGR